MLSFDGEELASPRPKSKVGGQHLSAVRDFLFGIFAAALRNWRPCAPSAIRERNTP